MADKARRTYVCDRCMTRITHSQIAVWADQEHVLCRKCWESGGDE